MAKIKKFVDRQIKRKVDVEKRNIRKKIDMVIDVIIDDTVDEFFHPEPIGGRKNDLDPRDPNGLAGKIKAVLFPPPPKAKTVKLKKATQTEKRKMFGLFPSRDELIRKKEKQPPAHVFKFNSPDRGYPTLP